jgi:hypothetical protein
LTPLVGVVGGPVDLVLDLVPRGVVGARVDVGDQLVEFFLFPFSERTVI